MKKIILLAAVTLAMTACDKIDDNVVPVSGVAKITATIGESVTSRAAGTDWAENDRIGISATVDNVEKYVNIEYVTEHGDGNFTGNPIYFYKPMSLTAYYPFVGPEGESPAVVSASTSADFQTKDKQPLIDFLFAGATSINTSGDTPEVNFNFAHQMSKITFIFVNGNVGENKDVDENGDAIPSGADVSKISSYQIDGLILDGTFDTATGVCAADPETETKSLTMTASGVVSGEAVPSLIIFPQSTVGKNVTLKIHDNMEQNYICELNFSDDAIKAGNNYRFTITVKKTELTVNKSSITNWNTEELEGNAGSDDTDYPEDNPENSEN